ncbi:hypothetical protein GALL_179940 [mine drainage metagenome]|uniref:Uncharacterized protein n=1 Tax=mine drainage metagenome TaxID=410659 RepID=A0A1J5RWB7_9ZZZZ
MVPLRRNDYKSQWAASAKIGRVPRTICASTISTQVIVMASSAAHKAFELEVKGLRNANEILKFAGTYFAHA